MSKVPHFHGSDLEEIEKYYQIPKEEIIGFGANVNPLGISSSVKQKIAENLDLISTYPDRNYTSLKAAIASYCNVNAAHIVIGNGSTELISLLIQHRHPKKALLLGPTYSEYERELNLWGGELLYYDLKAENDFQLDVATFLAILDDSIDLLILCNPNNPTSSAIYSEDMEKLLAHCQKHHIFVMIDETYVEFAPCVSQVTAMPFVSRYDNFMVLRGISKFYAAPGLRLGYGITSNQAFFEILKTYQNPWTLNSLGAYAGELMLQDMDYIEETRTLIDTERTKMYERLQKIDALKVYKPVANFILVQILKPNMTSHDVFDFLIRRKLMVRDCASFENLRGEFIRFCVMCPEENDKLMEGLEELFF